MRSPWHRCQRPDVEGHDVVLWTCPCGRRWVYETRVIQVETRPAVWDQWAQTEDESVTKWWRVV